MTVKLIFRKGKETEIINWIFFSTRLQQKIRTVVNQHRSTTMSDLRIKRELLLLKLAKVKEDQVESCLNFVISKSHNKINKKSEKLKNPQLFLKLRTLKKQKRLKEILHTTTV